MAKRYNGAPKINSKMPSERADERAMYRAEMRDEGYYAGMEPRRRQELEDSGMIREDHRAVANLPQGVEYKNWPVGGYYLPEGLDDTIRGVDGQMDLDGSQAKKNLKPKKV